MQNVHHTIIKVVDSKENRMPKELLSPLKEWDTLFAKAIASGEKPERDIFKGMENKTDQTEWEW